MAKGKKNVGKGKKSVTPKKTITKKSKDSKKVENSENLGGLDESSSSDIVNTPKKKRKAKRKKGYVALKSGESLEMPSKVRKVSNYNLVSSAVSKYCVENYNRKCTKKEISDIYNELKLRYLVSDPKYQLSAVEINSQIKSLLSNRNDASVPVSLFSFNWFELPSLFNQDGLFFKRDDVLRFDLRVINKGVLETTYEELNDVYRNDIYVWINEEIDEYERNVGELPSPIPTFELSAEESDEENRIFGWSFFSAELTSFLGTDFKPTREGRERVVGVTDKSLPSEKDLKSRTGLKKGLSADTGKSKEEITLDRDKLALEREKFEEEKFVRDLELVKMGLMDGDFFKEKWKTRLGK
jgi:hypothetical protein